MHKLKQAFLSLFLELFHFCQKCYPYQEGDSVFINYRFLFSSRDNMMRTRKELWFANDDLPINILSRLTTKTLHHVKYVSKKWLNLINDRSFVHFQLKKGEPVSGFFFQEIYQWAVTTDIKNISYIPVQAKGSSKVKKNVLDFLPESVVVLSSNNGLLCSRSCFPNSEPCLYVCNPLNKQWIRVKSPNISRYSSIAIAFDPFLNPIDSTTDFELVAVNHIENAEDEYHYLFDVYSSRTALWRRSNECCSCNHKLAKNKGIYIEGILYWLTDGYQILMFDPQNEISCLIRTPLPESQFSSIPEMCIGESKDSRLCYAIISEDGLQLWVLEDRFASEWGLRVSVSLDDLERDNERALYEISEKVASRLSKDETAWVDPLSFKDDTLLIRVLSKVYEYRFDVGKMRHLCDTLELGTRSMFAPIVVPYTMSLVPLV